MSVKEYVAVTVNMDQLMQTETNHRKCVMDYIEKKGKPEQVPNENADRSNTTSEPEKGYVEETGKLVQCTGENSTRTNVSAESEKKSISLETWLRIVEVLIIAAASLVVSIMSFRTEDLEYKLNLANSKLHVEVYCDTMDIDDDGIYDTNMLGVKYIDGIYEDFDIKDYTVITFKYSKTLGDTIKEINLIIRDYFFAGYMRGSGEYFYAKVTENNWSKYSDLLKYLIKDQKDFCIANVDLSHFVIISYKNIVGDQAEMGYQCGAGGRFDTANPAQIRMDIKEYEENGKITLEDLEPESFIRIVNELIENQEEAEKQ